MVITLSNDDFSAESALGNIRDITFVAKGNTEYLYGMGTRPGDTKEEIFRTEV